MFKDWENPEAVFQILKKISRGMPCDITGIRDYAMLDTHGGVQWPLAESQPLQENQRRLFSDGQFFTEDRKARFIFEAPRPAPEEVCSQYPFVLLTGRGTSSQWHTQTRTAKSPVLRKMYPAQVYVEINPEDACKLSIRDGQWVYISTRRGEIKAMPSVREGHIFVPMHYEVTNILTMPSFDPYSYQPSYKMAAARLAKAPYYYA
jgi:assimilatory nitrate reductase catalytic subunit